MQIDELVVKLVLDASGFTKGQREATAASDKMAADMVASASKGEKAQTDAAGRIVKALERIADQGDKLAGQQEAQQKKVAEATGKTVVNLEALARKFLGLYALVTAGRGLREFVSDLTSTDSALGRTARNIDIGAKALSTWQLAAEVSGGSAAGITGTMRNLSGELQRAALTGTSSVIPAFKALGITLADSKGRARDVRDILTDMNRRAQGMDPAQFTALANLAGISDEGTISMLEMKTEEFDKLIAAQQKYAATQADVDAAQKRQSSWRELLITSTSIGRTILTAVTPAIVGAMQAVQRWADANQGWIRTAIVEKVGQLADYLKGMDWTAIGKGVQDFTNEVRDIAKAADDATKGIDGNSALFKGLEALAMLAGVRVLGAVTGLTFAMGRLGKVPIPPVLAKAMGLGAAVAVGAAAESTPDADTQKRMDDFYKSHPDASANPFVTVGKWWKANAATWLGGDGPEAKARAADLDKRRQEQRAAESAAEAKTGQGGGFWADVKRYLGFGNDPKVKDNVEATAKATAGIFDLMRNGAAGAIDGAGGVTSSSGGRGGSGHHVDGSGAGASLRDRQFHGKGNFGQKGWWTPERQSHAVDTLMKDAGLSEDGAKALVARWRFVESAGGPTAVNPHSGAEGIAQWLGSRKGDGSNGSFDEQLAKVARELNGKESRAKNLLNTPGSEARGASAYERAEGWNAATATDNFTARVAEGMKHISHGAGSGISPASGPPAVTDGEVFAARARLMAGHPRPGDQALVGRYLKEQNTPPAKPESGQAPTVHHAMHAALSAIGRANRLTHHNDNRPVLVDVTERGASRIAHPINEALRHRLNGAHRAGYNHAIEQAAQKVSGVAHMHRAAGLARHVEALNHTVHNVDNSSATTIANMTVHTRAENGRQLAADLENHLARSREATQFNSGLA